MTIVFAKKLEGLALMMTAAVFVNGIGLQKVHAREVDLNTLCHKFPSNTRCQGYKFSREASIGSAATGQAPQIMKLRLKTSGPDNEWIRLEMSGSKVKLLHTTRAKTVFSQVLNSVAGAAPIPVPGVFNFYQWFDHPTTRVAFEPDSCSLLQRLKRSLNNSAPQSSQTSGTPGCTITGTDSVFLAEGMDIRRGRFTIEYKEGDLLRLITFRIPVEDS